LEKAPTVKFSKFFLKVFIATPIDVLCPNYVKSGRREISEIVQCLSEQKKTKFRLDPKLSLLRGLRPKSATASPQQCTQIAPDFIQISSQLQPNA